MSACGEQVSSSGWPSFSWRRRPGPRRRSTSRSRRQSRTSSSSGISSRATTTSITATTTRPSTADGSSSAREVDFVTSDELRLGVRGVFDYGTEPEHRQCALRGQLHLARAAYLDRYFLLWTPGRLALRGRRLRHAARRERDALGPRHPDARRGGRMRRRSTALDLTVTAAGFYAPQHHRDHASRRGPGRLEPGRARPLRDRGVGVLLELRPARPRSAVLPREPRDPRERTPRVPVEVPASRPARAAPVPRLRGAGARRLDGIHNFGAVAGKGHNAFEAGLTVGAVGTPGTGAPSSSTSTSSATPSSAPTTPTTGGCTPGPKATASGSRHDPAAGSTCSAFVVQRRLDSAYWIKRVTVDLVKMF